MNLQAASPPLILASGSATRAALLNAAGLRFKVMPSLLDEAAIKHAAVAAGASPEEGALLLAHAKAATVAAAHPEAIVIGADQILVCGADWFDKPADLAAARDQLRRLRGQSHKLVTGTVCCRADAVLWRHVESPHLTMRNFSDAFLDDYVALEAAHVTETVGSYRFEGPGVNLFEAVDGQHSAILGLPLLPLLAFLRRLEVLKD